MGGCVSNHKDVEGKVKCYRCIPGQNEQPVRECKVRISKTKKGRGKTVTPLSGASVAHRNKEAEGLKNATSEPTINNSGTSLANRHKEAEGLKDATSEPAINNFVPPSAEKPIIVNSRPESGTVNFHEEGKGHTPRKSNDSKEETFYDSVTFLESDVEDEFQSVNEGNTWGNPTSAQGTPRPSVAALKDRLVKVLDSNDTQATKIRIQKKKKLKEFFKEKLSADGGVLNEDYSVSADSKPNGFPQTKDVDYAATTVQTTRMVQNPTKSEIPTCSDGKHLKSRFLRLSSNLTRTENISTENNDECKNKNTLKQS
eukprot:TRINITY_DN6673_c0_g1_i4.p1 TRINITY_DN6673_c0_g1~~TRINITY_DN6673_c0_g1_i4.p1  ORF type:complete len:313 (-),score=66.64 TRINITY_DN6673_c0_g1_i4:294-1232(-)